MAAENFNTLKSWVQNVKQASLSEPKEPGEPATTGARASEHKSDVNKIVPGQNVDHGAKNPETGHQDEPYPGSGLKQTTTGKMPEVEKAVKVVREETEKMSNADITTDEGLSVAISSLRKAAAELSLISSLDNPNYTFNQPHTVHGGYEQTINVPRQAPRQKQAADDGTAALVDGYRKYGQDHAMLTVNYLNGFNDMFGYLKTANDDGSLMQMLAAQGGGGGAPPGGELPPEAMAGGAPPGAEGGAPPGAEGGMPPGAEGGQPTADDLAAALQELGISPQELEAALAKMQGQVEGDQSIPDEEKAEIKAAIAGGVADMKKVASHMRSGKFNLKPAADGTPERERRNVSKAYLQELLKAAG